MHVYMDTLVEETEDDKREGRAIKNPDEKSFKALSLL